MDLPNPELAIDYRPLTVSPDTLLLEMLSMMNQIRGSKCILSEETETNPKNYTLFGVSSVAPDLSDYEIESCVLVVEEGYIKGIVTERDIVKLVATEQNLVVTVAAVMTTEVITLIRSQFQDVFVALSLMRQHKIRHLPIVDDEGKLIGIVSPGSIRRLLKPASLLAVRRVRDVMTTQVIHTAATTSVLSLAQLMTQHQVSSIVITAIETSQYNSRRLIPKGIITERDIVQMQLLGLNLAEVSTESVMSQPLFCLHPEDSLWLAHQEMQRRFVRRLVVTNRSGELVGIVTQSSILRSLDPVELCSVVETLQQVVDQQTTELIEVNQRLHRQTEEVRRALEKEQELNRLKSQFISMVFHEFRNPLSAIIMSTETIYEARISEERKGRMLEKIQNSAQQMLKLIEDLLVMGRVDRANIQANPVPINLSYFCQILLEEFQFYDEMQHQIRFSYQGNEDNFVDFDEQWLRYILSNLLSNALKYSPPGRNVSLSLSVDEEQAIFQVEDEGIGIPMEDRSHLFDPFYRGRNVDSISGSGLGLAIVKNYVELLKGRISFRSEIGMGTTFVVMLPLTG